MFEENFDVAGTITVENAHPTLPMTVGLSDVLSDGTPVVIGDCSNGATYAGGLLTIPAATTTVCDYTADDLPYSDDAAAPDMNNGTITFNGLTYPFSDAIEWTPNRIRENATLTDDLGPLNESLTGHGDVGTYSFGPFTYTGSHTCESSRADYFVDGVYTPIEGSSVNWAYVNSDGEEQDRDDATTTWMCDASFVDLYKTTNGVPADPTMDIRFALYSGTSQLEVVGTRGVGALLQFQTVLEPGAPYTICEYPVPAAYTFEISVDGGVVGTYAGPPGEPNPTGEIQCFDFNALADPPGLITYDVENSYPGGAPRTPGYWKNWNRCTGGNQDETADALNDYLGPVDGAGVYLLDDLLPQTLGDYLTISICTDGVKILSAQDLTGKNKSSDAAYTLARALLAARLNQDAGACVPPASMTWSYRGGQLTFEQVLAAADRLLTQIHFTGRGDYLGPKVKGSLATTRNEALYLYGIIDDYNNSMLCTGEPSH